MSIVDVEKLKDALGTAQDVNPTPVVLGDSAKKVLDNLHADSDKAFDYALELITRIRKTCDKAEDAIKTKREDVKKANAAYVESLQLVSNLSEQSQKALGDVMIQGDRLGG